MSNKTRLINDASFLWEMAGWAEEKRGDVFGRLEC